MDQVRRLLAIMARLRDPARGCPWDREQTFATIAPYTIEEAYEVADAIQRGDLDALRDELGDLLFQVVFHARMAEEGGRFDFADVARSISDKMERRHPHVFGDAQVASVEDQSRAWEAHKAVERRAGVAPGERVSHLDGVSLALPALLRALKLQKRAARIGFDWPEISGVFAKLEEEAHELWEAREQGESAGRLEAELGDLLFTCVNLARHLALDPETALRHANARFEARFRRMEELLEATRGAVDGSSPEAMDAAWIRAKAEERARAGATGAGD